MRRWSLVLGTGLALGVCSVLADWSLEWRWFGGGGYAWARAASRVLNAASTWAALGLWAGWLMRTPGAGARGAAGALATAVAAYFVAFPVRWIVEGQAVDGFEPTALLRALPWLAAAAVLGPLLGYVGSLMRRPGPVGWLAAATLPVGVVYDYVVRVGFTPARFSLEPVRTSAEIAAMLAAVLVAGLAVVHARRSVFAQSEVTAVPEHVGWEQG